MFRKVKSFFKKSRFRKKCIAFITIIILIFLLIISTTSVVPTKLGDFEYSKPLLQHNNLDKIFKSKQFTRPIIGINIPDEEIFAAHKEVKLSANHPERKKLINFGGDINIYSTLDADQDNPAIVSDEYGNLLTIWERENRFLGYDIGLAYSIDGSSHWEIPGYFEVDGHPTQPRLDYYNEKIVYGTYTADPEDAFGWSYVIHFPDISNPNAQGGWANWYTPPLDGIGQPFTSADVACYPMQNPPNPEFWGIIGFTGTVSGDSGKDYNSLIIRTPAQGGGYYHPIKLNIELFNISVDIDKSNGQLFVVGDYINENYDENDPAYKGVALITKRITSNPDWSYGNWYGILFFYLSHPKVAANNGRVYMAAETTEFESKDIILGTSTDPLDIDSWMGYGHNSPNSDEFNPEVIVHSNDDATVIYTQNNNLYLKTFYLSEETWSDIERVNDNIGSVVEQYGCADITDNSVVWTDNRNGNNGIYLDTINFEAPRKPSQPLGPKSGKIGSEYTYLSITEDPQEDKIYYWYDWGDGKNSGWVGPYNSGETASASHQWTKQGNYQIKVKAKDIEDHESEWSDPLPVSMPKNKATNTLFLSFLDQHPRMLTLLRHLLGL